MAYLRVVMDTPMFVVMAGGRLSKNLNFKDKTNLRHRCPDMAPVRFL
jgi:hypothetical protein